MVELRRTVRFTIPAGEGAGGRNAFAGKPPMRDLGRYYEVDVVCVGEPDPATGYLIDIKRIDDAVRESLVPRLAEKIRQNPLVAPESVAGELFGALRERMGELARGVVWRLTPAQSIEIILEGDMPTSDQTRVLVRERFDFAASHRLHVPGLSEEENRRLFGKCNHPSGHGHNYRLETCVRLPIGTSGRTPFGVDDLERLVDELVLSRFDHKHLNLDTEEFREGSGLNPTVENIARVCYERLAPAVRGAGADAELMCVTVWETDRTSSTYPARRP
ncbi:MAG: 6-carboxytetrahydropterin synthase [Phycisphaerales bacterium]